MLISQENLNKLIEKAQQYAIGLSDVRDTDFNNGQIYGINLVLNWITETYNDGKPNEN